MIPLVGIPCASWKERGREEAEHKNREGRDPRVWGVRLVPAARRPFLTRPLSNGGETVEELQRPANYR